MKKNKKQENLEEVVLQSEVADTPVATLALNNIAPTAVVEGKKFSDFTFVDTIDPNASIAFELNGITNIRTSYQNMKQDIASNILVDGITDCSVFKYIAWEHTNGIPQNLPPHLIWCNGDTKLRSTDTTGLVGRFIDYMESKPSMKTFYQIPNDKSSFKTPDLRDLHTLGAGTFAPFSTQTTSKIVDPILNAITTVFNKTGLTTTNSGAHNSYDVKLTQILRIGDSIYRPDNIFYNASTVGYQGTSVIIEFLPSGIESFGNTGEPNRLYRAAHHIGTQMPYNVAIQPHTHQIFDHNHTASTVINRNTAVIGNRNTVPAIALFLVLDINVNRKLIAPASDADPILISDVQDLQAALDAKLPITTFNTFTPTVYTKTETYSRTQVDTLLNITLSANYYTKSEIDVYFSNYYTETQIDALFANYYTKTQVDNSFTTTNNNVALKLNTTTFDAFTPTVYTKTEVYNKTETYTKTEVDTIVAGIAATRTITRTANYTITDAALTNLFTGLTNANISPNPSTSLQVITAGTNCLLVPNRRTGRAIIAMSIRITGTVGGNANTRQSFIASLRRASDNSEVASKLFEKVVGTTFSNEAITVITAVNSPTDPFTVGGFYIGVQGIAGSTATITSYNLLYNIVWE